MLAFDATAKEFVVTGPVNGGRAAGTHAVWMCDALALAGQGTLTVCRARPHACSRACACTHARMCVHVCTRARRAGKGRAGIPVWAD